MSIPRQKQLPMNGTTLDTTKSGTALQTIALTGLLAVSSGLVLSACQRESKDEPEASIPAHSSTQTEPEQSKPTNGHVSDLSPPPRIDTVVAPAPPRLASMRNFRDLAGADVDSVYRTAQGRTLRRGVFYRSNAITPNAEDLATLNTLGIRVVYDLRTPGEVTKAPNQIPDGAEYVHINLFGSEYIDQPTFTSAEQTIRMMEDAERLLVTNADIRARLAHLLTHMANADGAVIFHCTAGKDRTGWVAALLHSIAGVEEDIIINDYLLTNTYTQDWITSSKQNALEEHGQEFADALTPILGVQESFLRAGFEQITQSYGSMEHYLTQGLGLDEQTLATLRDKLLE